MIFGCVFVVVVIGDLVDAETSSLDGQRPADNYDEDAICEVEIVGIYDIQPKGHENRQPSQAIQVNSYCLPLILPVNLKEQMREIDLKQSQRNKQTYDSNILNEVVGDGLEDVPFEEVPLDHVVGGDVHEAEVDAALKHQGFKTVKF